MPQVSCPSCTRALSLPETMLGQQVRCPLCNNIFQVAGAPPAARQFLPASAAPPPAGSEFAFDQPARRSAAPRGPEQEFDFDEAHGGMEGIRGCMSVRRGASALQVTFVCDLLVYIFFLLLQLFAPTPMGTKVVIIVLVTVLFLVPVVFIQIGSIQLNSGRGQGLVITGCVMAFIVSLELLIYSGFMGMVLLAAMRSGAALPAAAQGLLFFILIFVIWCFAAFVVSLIGGIRGLVALARRAPRNDNY